MRTPIILLVSLLLILTASCANRMKKAVRDVKYSAWEKVGYEKRDLFKREISNVTEEQEDSQEAFKDALTKLKDVYGYDGGNLEKIYKKLNSSYEDAQGEAAEASGSITKLNTVAQDLFEEWNKEIEEIQTSDLRKKSSKQLSETKSRYQDLYSHLKTTEAKIVPVLARLKDQVLFIKHNLNAKAIGGLKTESNRIESDIEKLIQDMNDSNKEAEEFIKTL